MSNINGNNDTKTQHIQWKQSNMTKDFDDDYDRDTNHQNDRMTGIPFFHEIFILDATIKAIIGLICSEEETKFPLLFEQLSNILINRLEKLFFESIFN